METLKGWFDEFTRRTGEHPTHIVFGSVAEWRDDDEWPIATRDALIDFDAIADAIMDQPFDGGFGGNETPNLCAWSESWVIFSDNYDGAEGLQWVPRNPVDHAPIRPGGS